MICIKCKQEIKEGVRFCPKCGAQQEPSQERKPKGNRGLMIGIVAAAALLAAAGLGLGVLVFALKDRIDPGDGLLASLRHGAEAEEGEAQTEEELSARNAAPGDGYPVHIRIFAANEALTDENGEVLSDPLADAEVDIREGSGTRKGEALANAKASEDGSISVNLVSGIYTAEIKAPGYLTGYMELEVADGEADCNGWVIPAPTEDQTAVILTWDEADTDLDLTVFTPSRSGEGDMAHIGGGIAMDDRGNFLVSDNKGGCEVAYLNTADTGSYKIFVNDYTDSTAGNYTADRLGMGNTHIYIYNNLGFVADYACPATQNGVVWEVAEVDRSSATSIQRVYREITGKSWWIAKKGKKYLKSEFTTPSLYFEAYYYDWKGNVAATSQLGSYMEYTHDERGNILSETLYSNSEFIRRTEYTYDENGNKILEKYFYPEDGGVCNCWTEYTYDSHGNLTDWIRRTSNATLYGEGESEHYSYEYDARGNILVKRSQYLVGSDDNEIRYTYDDSDNVVSEDWYDYEGVRYFSKLYTYDARGNVLTVQTTSGDRHDRTEYIYDDMGNVLSEKYSCEESDGVRTSEYRNTYDSDGNILEKVSLDNGVTDEITTYEYYNSLEEAASEKWK